MREFVYLGSFANTTVERLHFQQTNPHFCYSLSSLNSSSQTHRHVEEKCDKFLQETAARQRWLRTRGFLVIRTKHLLFKLTSILSPLLNSSISFCPFYIFACADSSFMCSEIDRFSSFLRRNMSGARSTPFPHVKEQDKPKSLDDQEEVATQMEGKGNSDDGQKEVEKITNKKEGEEEEEDTDGKDRVSVSVYSEKQLPDNDDDVDGFRTPTTSDHKIPAIVECPPAPRKPRPEPSRLKRKASPPFPHELDSTAEIESIFRPISSQNTAEEKKPKKARREEED